MMRALLCALLLWALPAVAANYTDLWWNKTEPGWGLTLTHQNNKIFGVWYVYDATGKAIWVAMPDGVFSNTGRTFTGPLYSTTGPSYSKPASAVQGAKATQVGKARIDFAVDGVSATVTYNIGSASVVKHISRQPFGTAPANAPNDHSDLWWDPDEAGWGMAITQHGGVANAVWYTYGDDGKPMWIVMPDGRYSQPGRFAGKLYVTEGGSFYGTKFNPASVIAREVGSGTVTIIGSEGRFTGVVNGYVVNKRLTRQLFGAAKPANKKPAVTLSLVPMASPPVALLATGAALLVGLPTFVSGLRPLLRFEDNRIVRRCHIAVRRGWEHQHGKTLDVDPRGIILVATDRSSRVVVDDEHHLLGAVGKHLGLLQLRPMILGKVVR